MEKLNIIINNPIIIKVILSIVIIIIGAIVTRIINHFIFRKNFFKSTITKTKSHSAKKAIDVITVCLFGFLILSVWVNDPLSFIWGLIGVVAIGFFAVWSILSNIVAGLLIMISQPFTVDDHITILPEDISGKVLDYTYLFIKLLDEEKNTTYIIPNNMIFQKIIKKS